jgi:hypothetical protein
MEDTTTIGPVATTSRGKKEGGVGLLEKVTSISEVLFLSSRHTVRLGGVRARSSKWEVVSLKLTIELFESLDEAVFNVTSLLECVAGRESEASDRSSSSASSGQNVLTSRINFGFAEVSGVHVSGMLGIGSVTSMTSRDNRVHNLLEQSPRFFVTSYETAGLNHRVTLVIDTSLNAMADIDTKLGLSILKLTIERGVLLEDVSEVIGVSTKVGELGRQVVSRESSSFLRAVVFVVTTTKLNPHR